MYLSLSEAGERAELDKLQDDAAGGPGVAEGNEEGGQLHQVVGVEGEGHVVIAQGLTQGVKWNTLRLILRHVPLKGVNSPMIVKHESD